MILIPAILRLVGKLFREMPVRLETRDGTKEFFRIRR